MLAKKGVCEVYKYWTVQHKNVIEIINNCGIYKAEITKSPFVKENPDLVELYTFVRNSFNQINNFNTEGLIFGFAFSEGETVYCFNHYEGFMSFIKNKKMVIDSLWKKFCDGNHVVLEIEYDIAFNPIFIDMNDFQFLMPPLMLLPPYTKESFSRIITNIQNGDISVSEFPSNLLQVHLPFIDKKSIVNVYPVFSLE